MNPKTEYKVLDFLKSEGVIEAQTVVGVGIDPDSLTVDIWYGLTSGARDVFEISCPDNLERFLDYIVK